MFHAMKNLVIKGNKKKDALRILVILFCILLTTILGIWFLHNNKSEDKMNRESIDALLKIIFISPNKDLVKHIPFTTSYTGSDAPEATVGELNQLTDLLMEQYLPYCTEKESKNLMMASPQVRFQMFTDTYGYQISVDHIEIQQNKTDPRNYDFKVYLLYGPVGSEQTAIIDSGSVQCLEKGKVSYLRFYDNRLFRILMELEEELSKSQ
jgi:hypothetical protein